MGEWVDRVREYGMLRVREASPNGAEEKRESVNQSNSLISKLISGKTIVMIRHVRKFINSLLDNINIMLCDINKRGRAILPFKNRGFTTSFKKREKDMLKEQLIIYQLSTVGKYHIEICCRALFSQFSDFWGKTCERNDLTARLNLIFGSNHVDIGQESVAVCLASVGAVRRCQQKSRGGA